MIDLDCKKHDLSIEGFAETMTRNIGWKLERHYLEKLHNYESSLKFLIFIQLQSTKYNTL